MGLRLLFIAFIALTQVSAASQSCSTKYANTSGKVTTTTVTSTRTAVVTTTVVTSTVTNTSGYAPITTTVTTTSTVGVSTFWVTKAKATSTVPIPNGFTVAASALSSSCQDPDRKRTALPEPDTLLRARATSSYPAQVICTSTAIKSGTATATTTVTTAGPSTVTSYKVYSTYVISTSTVSVATRTVHAACQPSSGNVIDFYNGQAINFWEANGYKNSHFPDPSDPDYTLNRDANQSPQACCEMVFNLNYGGFQYYGAAGFDGQCITVDQGQCFFYGTGPFGEFGHITVGNGYGTPTYDGFFDYSNPFS